MCDCYSEDETGKTAAIYVLASLVILLSIMVAYLLYKMKNRKYSTMADDQNVSTMETASKIEHPQLNQEKEEPPELNFGTLKKKAEEVKVLVLNDEIDGSQRLTNPIKTPFPTTPQINIGELKSHIMKTRHGIIHRDDIQKICKNELTKSDQTLNKPNNTYIERSKVKTAISQIEKSASVNLMLEEDDEYDVLPTAKPVEAYDTAATNIGNELTKSDQTLNKPNNDYDESSKIKTAISQIEKSVSVNLMMDEDDKYDVLPTAKPVEAYDTTATSIQNLQSILLERVKRKTSLSKTGKTLSSPQLLQSDEEYDVLPSSRPVVEEIYDVIGSPNNVIILDPDTHYLSFISQTPPATEPSYINANLNI